MSVQSDLEHSMTEELSASAYYRKRAENARARGDEVSAGLWMHIAEEEVNHYNKFRDRLNSLTQQIYLTPPSIEAERVVRAGPEVWARTLVERFGESSRPFPHTDADWEDLGYDIEAKLPPGSFTDRAEVRHQVAVATFKEEGDADDAKRWLVKKAGELGIR